MGSFYLPIQMFLHRNNSGCEEYEGNMAFAADCEADFQFLFGLWILSVFDQSLHNTDHYHNSSYCKWHFSFIQTLNSPYL